jgi:hypothetical protein
MAFKQDCGGKIAIKRQFASEITKFNEASKQHRESKKGRLTKMSRVQRLYKTVLFRYANPKGKLHRQQIAQTNDEITL